MKHPFERIIPLQLVELDGHIRIRCTATPDTNGGEPCVWSWPVLAAMPGKAFGVALNHALDRHMDMVPYGGLTPEVSGE